MESPDSDVTEPPSMMSVLGFEMVPPLPTTTPFVLLVICVFVVETKPRSCTRIPSLFPRVVTRLSEISSELRPTEESPGALLFRVVMVMFRRDDTRIIVRDANAITAVSGCFDEGVGYDKRASSDTARN